MDKKSLVVQSNSLVEAKYRLSVEEQKIIKILISQIKRDDKDFHNYEFRIMDLAEMLGMEHKDPYGVLEKITERLISRVLKFYNPETQTLLQASWLSSAEYKKGFGTVALCFDPKLKPLLLQLQSYFTKYELGQVMQFKGQYAIRFFELRKSFLGRNKKEVCFSLKELWEIFKLKQDEYKQFFDFKRRVLEPARLELLEKTGKSFFWETIKRGRGGKVVGVRFVFDEEIGETERENMATLKSDPEAKSRNNVEEKTKTSAVLNIDPEPVKQKLSEGAQLLLENGISENIAVQLGEQYEMPYLREKASLANAHPEYVKNKAGFLIQAIKENWVDDDIVREQKKEMRLNDEKRLLETRKRVKGIWDRYKVQRDNLGLKKYERMTVEEIEKIKKQFLNGLQGVVHTLYQKKESFGYVEDGMFRSFFLSQFIPTRFEDFLVAEGITLSDEEREILEKEVRR